MTHKNRPTVMTCAGSADSGMMASQAIGGGAIPTSALHIRRIPWHVAISFIREHHYLGNSTPVGGVNFAFGVFTASSDMAPMIGALLYMRPAGANRMTDGHQLLELRRMVILDVTAKNAESRCLAVTARMLKKMAPWCKALISYSDIEGMGHKGTIYKAAGWMCEGSAGGATWKSQVRPGRSDRGSLTRKIRWRKALKTNSAQRVVADGR